MAKINAYALPRHERKIRTKTFSDPLFPGPNERALLEEAWRLNQERRGLPEDEPRWVAAGVRLRAIDAQLTEERPANAKVTLTLQDASTDAVLVSRVEELAAQYVQEWATPRKPGEPPQIFPALDGNIYRLTPGIWRFIAFIQLMQPPEVPPEDRYNEFDLVPVVDRLPNAWEDIKEWVSRMVMGLADETEAAPDPNAVGAAPAVPSAAPPLN